MSNANVQQMESVRDELVGIINQRIDGGVEGATIFYATLSALIEVCKAARSEPGQTTAIEMAISILSEMLPESPSISNIEVVEDINVDE